MSETFSVADRVVVITGAGQGIGRVFAKSFASGGARLRRIGIVALARKLLIALWRYLATGQLPDGAQLKELPA